MGFLQNDLFQVRVRWYAETFFVPQHSGFVYGESGGFSFGYLFLDSVNASVVLLGFLALTNQGGLQFYAG